MLSLVSLSEEHALLGLVFPRFSAVLVLSNWQNLGVRTPNLLRNFSCCFQLKFNKFSFKTVQIDLQMLSDLLDSWI